MLAVPSARGQAPEGGVFPGGIYQECSQICWSSPRLRAGHFSLGKLRGTRTPALSRSSREAAPTMGRRNQAVALEHHVWAALTSHCFLGGLQELETLVNEVPSSPPR